MAKYCPYCASKIEQGNSCPYCDGALHYRPKEHHLKPGSLLHNKYLVGRVLGEGGFGITYVGRDLTLDMKVAIKEYYPNRMAARTNQNASTISLFDWSFSNDFKKGKEEFINEAQTIAKMDKESAVVTVRDFFEENNSAYIVMEFVEGEDLRTIIKKQQKPMDSETLLPLLEPVFSALDELHGIGLTHRDISSDNIMVENDRARLIDFGCARETVADNQTEGAVLKHSFSPVEQYENRNMGPWTDVYAMGATIYYCLTGRLAPKATDRVMKDELVSPNTLGAKLKPKQEKALMKALAVLPQDRYQSMADFGKDLFIHKNRGRRIAYISVAAAMLAVAAFFAFKPEATVDVQEREKGTYVIVGTQDELTPEEQDKLQQVTDMLTDLSLEKNEESYSTGYSLEIRNTSNYDFEALQTTIRYFDGDGVEIGSSHGNADTLKKGETRNISFTTYGKAKLERAEIRATVRDDERGLITDWIPLGVTEVTAEAFSVELQNSLPETFTYSGRDGTEYSYTITDFSYTTNDVGNSYWTYCYLAGTYDRGPDDRGGYLSYEVLNEDGEAVDSGTLSMSRLRQGDSFEKQSFTVYSLPKGHYTVVLKNYK